MNQKAVTYVKLFDVCELFYEHGPYYGWHMAAMCLKKPYVRGVRGRLLVASALHTIIATMALDFQLPAQLHKYREESLQPTDVTYGYESDPPVST